MPHIYANLAIIECVDAAALESALNAGLEPYVVRRISDTAVVVDHVRIAEITKMLRRQLQTPKITVE